MPLADIVEQYPQLQHVVWVVQQGSRHLDWNEVPEGFGGKVGVSVWHELVEEKKHADAADNLPYDGDGHPSAKVVTVWQKREDDIGEIIEFTQGVRECSFFFFKSIRLGNYLCTSSFCSSSRLFAIPRLADSLRGGPTTPEHRRCRVRLHAEPAAAATPRPIGPRAAG